MIETTPNNAKNLLAALLESGIGTASLTSPEDLLSNEITILKNRVRIDILTSAPGLSFEDAWKNNIVMKFEGQGFNVVSKDDLIASKRASGRPVDKEDIHLLEIDKNDDKA